MIKYMNLIALALVVMVFMPLVAFAQDPEAGGSICFNNLNDINTLIVMIVGVVVTVASTLANVIGKDNFLGKIVHFFAVNIKVDKVK